MLFYLIRLRVLQISVFLSTYPNLGQPSRVCRRRAWRKGEAISGVANERWIRTTIRYKLNHLLLNWLTTPPLAQISNTNYRCVIQTYTHQSVSKLKKKKDKKKEDEPPNKQTNKPTINRIPTSPPLVILSHPVIIEAYGVQLLTGSLSRSLEHWIGIPDD